MQILCIYIQDCHELPIPDHYQLLKRPFIVKDTHLHNKAYFHNIFTTRKLKSQRMMQACNLQVTCIQPQVMLRKSRHQKSVYMQSMLQPS